MRKSILFAAIALAFSAVSCQKPQEEPAHIELFPEEIHLPKEALSKEIVSVDANYEFQALVQEDCTGWLGATVEGSSVVVTALTANEQYEPRTGSVTVVCRELSAVLMVTQAPTPEPVESVVGQLYKNEGVIYWQDPENPRHIKVVSAKAEKLAWKNERTADDVGSDTYADYKSANEAIRAKAGYSETTYPAFWYCDKTLGGWYLPNTAEAKLISAAYSGKSDYKEVHSDTEVGSLPEDEAAARTAFDALLTSVEGGVVLNTAATANGDSSWMCNDKGGDGTDAIYWLWGKLKLLTGVKNSTARYARCIKEATLE